MKNLFWILICFLLPLSISAQTFTGGLLAGISSCQVDGDQNAGYEKVGFWGGAFVRNKFSEYSGIQLGVHYIGKGSKRNANPEAGDYTSFRNHLDYIEIPVLYNFYLKKRFIFEGGLGFGYLFRSKLDDESGTIPEEQYQFNDMDYNVQFGFNYLITKHLFINIRFSYSILPIADDPSRFNRVLGYAFYYEF